jgi:NTE family protein
MNIPDKDNQPRLLLVAVDVADGISVTFDRYPKEDGTRKTEYGRFLREDNREIGFEHVVHYDEGIISDQVMASASYPVNFDFTKIEVQSYSSKPTNNQLIEAKTSSTVHANSYRKGMRYFWDGGLMTNTPLMQLVLLDRHYWLKVRRLKDNVPRLGICVVNLHPKKQKEIPSDRDGVVNRNNDITFSDRTEHEETMLLLISDYIDLIRKLLKIAEEKGDIIANILNQRTNFHGQFLKPARFQDILEGRFQIDEIIRVNRENDLDAISPKP